MNKSQSYYAYFHRILPQLSSEKYQALFSPHKKRYERNVKEPKRNMKELAEKTEDQRQLRVVCFQKGSGRQDGYREEVQADKDTCACENN